MSRWSKPTTDSLPHCVLCSVIQLSDYIRPHGLYPTRILCLWDFPGKNTGAGCHFPLQGISISRNLLPLLQLAGRVFTIAPSLSHWLKLKTLNWVGFPDSSVGKESACTGDPGSIPGLERFPGEGKGYLLQYSGLENSMECISMGLQRVRHNWATLTELTELSTKRKLPKEGEK